MSFHPVYVQFIADRAAEGELCTQNTDCQSTLLCDGNKKVCRTDGTKLANPSGSFCNNNLCQEWEGDCDIDSHCSGSLKCGNNNCPAHFYWPSGHDCCYMPGIVPCIEVEWRLFDGWILPVLRQNSTVENINSALMQGITFILEAIDLYKMKDYQKMIGSY